MRPRLFLRSLALLLIGGTGAASAQEAGYPSLAKRPIESRDRDAEVAARSAAAARLPADPALAATLAPLAGKARDGAAAFDRLYPDTDRAVTRAEGAAPASETWVVAQQAVSTLEAARYDCVASLATLDTLYVERLDRAAAEGAASGDVPLIEFYRAPVAVMVDSQNDRLDRLKASLSLP
jgi:hypothetical protein